MRRRALAVRATRPAAIRLIGLATIVGIGLWPAVGAPQPADLPAAVSTVSGSGEVRLDDTDITKLSAGLLRKKFTSIAMMTPKSPIMANDPIPSMLRFVTVP